ncbi:hypothetical protein CPB85DRAFT_703761 [Mucidula mucida]|nr:hypothetical protein CPB85DRAFT_703761 [Mucidula mucida]
MRNGSVFADRKFIQGGSQSPKAMNASIIHLPENASRFRDLLWALHHLDLGNPRFVYDPSIHRLLNIAELSRKYRFLPIETWAVDQLHRICSSGPLPFSLSSLRDSSSSITLTSCVADDVQSVDTICSRLLNIAFSSRHRSLFLLMIKKLVVQTLWHDFHAGPSLVETIETLSRCRSRYQRHVHQLLGVVYYRMLVDMKFMIATDKSPVVLFPPDMDVERRMRFLTAHRSLTEMWDDLKHAPPEVSFSSDDAHISCQENWDRLWGSAARKVEVAPCDCKQRCRAGHRRHTADVLALLKLTMLTISQTIQDSQLICGECSLAGLESIDIIRDDIINSLGDLFVYSS